MRGHLDAFAVVAVAVCLFVGSLLGLARVVDNVARAREEVLIRNALDHSVREAAERVIAVTDWDDAIRYLDNGFNAPWADRNIGKYFIVTHGMAPSFVLGSSDQPIYRLNDRRHPEWSDYSIFAPYAAPLLAKVRDRERRRGSFKRPLHAGNNISAPIHEGAFFRTRAGPYLIVAGLVQPDFGTALPRGPRAPIVIVAQKIDDAFLARLGERLTIRHLKMANRATKEARTITDSKGRAVLRLIWAPFRPGGQIAAIALLPVLAGVLLLLVLYFRGRAAAIKLRQSNGELATARDAAIRASRVKSQFLANMSHELRTPLNAILGFAEMLGSDRFAARRVQYAEFIHRSGSQLLSLVNDLLDLSRIEAGRFVPQPETVDLDSLIAECLTSFVPRCAAKGIDLRRVPDGPLASLIVDRRALQQVLLNLLSNAVKFTGRGKGIRVFVGEPSAHGIEFGVEDEGAGIAEGDQASVFERFGQGRHDLERNPGGAGLGLPIVKGLVEAHGGTVALSSLVGVGTRVTVHLPPPCVAKAKPLDVAA